MIHVRVLLSFRQPTLQSVTTHQRFVSGTCILFGLYVVLHHYVALYATLSYYTIRSHDTSLIAFEVFIGFKLFGGSWVASAAREACGRPSRVEPCRGNV